MGKERKRASWRLTVKMKSMDREGRRRTKRLSLGHLLTVILPLTTGWRRRRGKAVEGSEDSWRLYPSLSRRWTPFLAVSSRRSQEIFTGQKLIHKLWQENSLRVSSPSQDLRPHTSSSFVIVFLTVLAAWNSRDHRRLASLRFQPSDPRSFPTLTSGTSMWSWILDGSVLLFALRPSSCSLPSPLPSSTKKRKGRETARWEERTKADEGSEGSEGRNLCWLKEWFSSATEIF